jgi:hypothetical protein
VKAESPNPFGITKDDVLRLCADRILEQVERDVSESIHEMVKQKVSATIASQVQNTISSALKEEMERIITSPITPVNMWGEITGKPTTIRDQLAMRAKTFFEEKVNQNGQVESYGGRPRYEWAYTELATKAFNEAIKANAETIALTVKQSVRSSLWASINEALNAKFNVKEPTKPSPALPEGGAL